jgi:hypothetical protein
MVRQRIGNGPILSRIFVRESGHKRPKADKPSDEYARFEKLAKQLISVSKSEIDKREAEYQRHKKPVKKRTTA